MESLSLRLISCSASIFESVLESNDKISEELNINVIDEWTEFGLPAFQYGLKKVVENPSSQKWWTYLPIHIESNTLIGSCGFKGPPKNGQVEIGYEVTPSYRNKGYATEIVNQLINIAQSDKAVKKIIAHTLAERNASTSVLTKCNFTMIEEINDPDDGLVLKWELIL